MIRDLPNLPPVRNGGELSRFVDEIFSSLPRADQRRWAEAYLGGLMMPGGRKSIRRMAAGSGGVQAIQSLQHFLNQSPWEWGPVRRAIAEEVLPAVDPTAWVVDEVVVPKNGSCSVGVARQYAQSLGRTVNGQLGFSLSLTGAGTSVPVNWRLVLPSSWADECRRRRAYVPEGERLRQPWEYMLDMVDETAADWGLPPLPVVLDCRHGGPLHELLAGLRDRRVDFLVRVAGSVRAGLVPDSAWGSVLHPVGDGREPVDQRAMPLVDLVRAARDRRAQVLGPSRPAQEAGGGSLSLPVRLADPAERYERFRVVPRRSVDRQARPEPPLRLLARWSRGGKEPDAVWLTTLRHDRVAGLLALADLPARSRPQLRRLRDEFGLYDFEGRSYRGWHHHMTLVSAAHAFGELQWPGLDAAGGECASS